MINYIIGLIISLILLSVYHSLLISKNNLLEEEKTNKELLNIITTVLMTLALYFLLGYFSYQILTIYMAFEWLKLIIIALILGIISLLITVIPYLTLNDKYPEKVINFLKVFDYLSLFIFYLPAQLYLLLRKIAYIPEKEIMTEDQFLDIVDLAEEQFGINENESKLIKNVLDFDQMRVLDIYTPRTEIIAAEKKQTVEEVKEIFKTSGYSRLPVYDETLDNIIGTINFKDLYNSEATTRKELRKVMVDPLEVTEYMNLNDLLTLLKANKQHLAIVKDEYGGTVGIVSLEDLLEELVGDIYDEHDKEVKTIEKISNNIYQVTGQTYLDDLEEIFNLDDLNSEDYLTVNGFVLSQLEKMAEVGDSFIYKNLKVTVLKADDKVTKLVEIEVLE